MISVCCQISGEGFSRKEQATCCIIFDITGFLWSAERTELSPYPEDLSLLRLAQTADQRRLVEKYASRTLEASSFTSWRRSSTPFQRLILEYFVLPSHLCRPTVKPSLLLRREDAWHA